jgi:hypothetical protein
MKYFDPFKKAMLPNKAIDQFLIELHHLCKKHKLVIVPPSKGQHSIEKYSKTSAHNMLSNVINRTTMAKKIEKRKIEDEKS